MAKVYHEDATEEIAKRQAVLHRYAVALNKLKGEEGDNLVPQRRRELIAIVRGLGPAFKDYSGEPHPDGGNV